jgi:uncharacterized protein
VILVDSNLLIYAHINSLPQHAAARQWLDEQLESSPRVGLPWASLLNFLRLVTNARVFSRAVSISSAMQQVKEWLSCEPAWIPMPLERHAEVLEKLLRDVTSPYLIPDAHLAALAIEHGLTLCSADGDFARFPGLRWENPLQAGS